MSALTTKHLNQALDLAARRGLCARDIADVRLAPDGSLKSIVIRAALPAAPKKPFTFEIRSQP